jgi:hypothetical protein
MALLIDWVLYILLVVLLMGFILAEHQATWVQFLLGVPAIGVGLAIFTRKLHPKLFSADDTLSPSKQYGITLGVVVALIGVIGGGAIYVDTYHNPGRGGRASSTSSSASRLRSP